jgi:hypothetical protein
VNRVSSHRQIEAVGWTMDWLPWRLAEMAATDIFCGDPIFAGLHETVEIGDGRTYRTEAHVCFPCHVPDRRVTVVLPVPETPRIVLHELGHVLDWHLISRAGEAIDFQPVSAYAKTNRMEAFAEAFVAWCYGPDATNSGLGFDRESREFFDRLASGGW